MHVKKKQKMGLKMLNYQHRIHALKLNGKSLPSFILINENKQSLLFKAFFAHVYQQFQC